MYIQTQYEAPIHVMQYILAGPKHFDGANVQLHGVAAVVEVVDGLVAVAQHDLGAGLAQQQLHARMHMWQALAGRRATGTFHDTPVGQWLATPSHKACVAYCAWHNCIGAGC